MFPFYSSARLFNASSAPGPLNLFLEGKPWVAGLAFGQAAGRYALAACPMEISIYPAGPDGPMLLKKTLDFSCASPMTLALADSSRQGIDLLLLPDPKPGENQLDFARVRGLNLSAEHSLLDLSFDGGQPLQTNIAYGSCSPYHLLPPGTWSFEISRLWGPGWELSPNALKTPLRLKLRPGESRTLCLIGAPWRPEGITLLSLNA